MWVTVGETSIYQLLTQSPSHKFRAGRSPTSADVDEGFADGFVLHFQNLRGAQTLSPGIFFSIHLYFNGKKAEMF